MNIPQGTLQAVADAAFKELNIIYLASDPLNGECQADCRRAVIQHALDNPALAPFLAGGIGEYTDEELMRAWNHREYRGGKMSTTRNLRAFLAALPRREIPALAEATPPAEPEPAAQVPLGPEDCPPGSVFRNSTMSWYRIKYAINDFVRIDVEGNNLISYEELKDLWQINTSLPDTGRWDATAWRPCSKPAGKEVAK